MFPNTPQDVDQVGVHVNNVETTSHDKALHDAYMSGAELSPTKIPIFAAHRDRAQRALRMVRIHLHVRIG